MMTKAVQNYSIAERMQWLKRLAIDLKTLDAGKYLLRKEDNRFQIYPEAISDNELVAIFNKSSHYRVKTSKNSQVKLVIRASLFINAKRFDALSVILCCLLQT